MSDFKEKLDELGEDIKEKAEDLKDDAIRFGHRVDEDFKEAGDKIKDSDLGEKVDEDYNKVMGRVDLAADDVKDKVESFVDEHDL